MPMLETPIAYATLKQGPVRSGEPESGKAHQPKGDRCAALSASNDDRIVAELQRLSDADDDYWTFRGGRRAGRARA